MLKRKKAKITVIVDHSLKKRFKEVAEQKNVSMSRLLRVYMQRTIGEFRANKRN